MKIPFIDFLFSGCPTSWVEALQKRNFAAIADWFTRCFFAAGVLGLIFAALAAAAGEQTVPSGTFVGLRIFALGLLFASACTVSGWMLGLLFGIPRTLAQGVQTTPTVSTPSSSTTDATKVATENHTASRVNTNLEDISDWLTKTIIGVGLTQLFGAPRYIWHIADQLNVHGFGWNQYGQIYAFSLILLFVPGGFWLGYVGTRTILTKLFDSLEIDPALIRAAGSQENFKLDPGGKDLRPPNEKVAKADEELLKLPREALSTTSDIIAWAAAHARAGNLGIAQQELEALLAKDPNNREIKEMLVTVYWASGNEQRAHELLADIPDSPVAMLDALYQLPPAGFQKAIAIGKKLLNTEQGRKDPNVHVWMACAYGQMYALEKKQNSDSAELANIKKRILLEIQAAVTLDPDTRDWLRSLWKPDPGSPEDDLAALGADDPDLIELLGS